VRRQNIFSLSEIGFPITARSLHSPLKIRMCSPMVLSSSLQK